MGRRKILGLPNYGGRGNSETDEENEVLQADLYECKSGVFALQLQSQVPDTSIMKD